MLGICWIYFSDIPFADDRAGGVMFGLALGALLAGFVAPSHAEPVAKFA